MHACRIHTPQNISHTNITLLKFFGLLIMYLYLVLLLIMHEVTSTQCVRNPSDNSFWDQKGDTDAKYSHILHEKPNNSILPPSPSTSSFKPDPPPLPSRIKRHSLLSISDPDHPTELGRRPKPPPPSCLPNCF